MARRTTIPDDGVRPGTTGAAEGVAAGGVPVPSAGPGVIATTEPRPCSDGREETAADGAQPVRTTAARARTAGTRPTVPISGRDGPRPQDSSRTGRPAAGHEDGAGDQGGRTGADGGQHPGGVLGGGDVDIKLEITADAWSGSAKEKIEAAGGSLTAR